MCDVMSDFSGRRPSSDADGALGRLRDLIASNRYASYFLGFELALVALGLGLDALAPNGTQTIRMANLLGGLAGAFALLIAGIVAIGLLGAGGWLVAARV